MGGVIVVALVVLFLLLNSKFGWIELSKSSAAEEETTNYMPPYARKSDKNIQIAYSYLAGWLIKKNSRDSHAKVQFIRSYFKTHFHTSEVDMIDELSHALRYNTNVRSVAQWVLKHMKQGKERTDLIDFLFELAGVDGEIIDREFVAIVRLAELIGVRASYLEKKLKEYQQQKFRSYQESGLGQGSSKRAKALLALQLTEGYTKEQLKRAYRKLVVKYHPDKCVDDSPAEKKLAQQKFMEIQEAYDFLSN